MKKKYDIKTTDVETLKKWYHLMTLGRALDEKAPSYLLQSLGHSLWLWLLQETTW